MSFKIHSTTIHEIPKNPIKPLMVTTTEINAIKNLNDDFGEDLSTLIEDKEVIVPANTTILHHTK